MTSQRIGIESGTQRDGVIDVRSAHGWQCLDHQPCRIIRIFKGETAIGCIRRDEGAQIDFRRAGMMLRDGHSDGDVLGAGQDREILLLTIGETLATDRHLTDEQRMGIVGCIAEGSGSRPIGLQTDGL